MVLRVHCRILTSAVLTQTMKLTSSWGKIDQNHSSGLISVNWRSDLNWNISHIIWDISARKIQNCNDVQAVRNAGGHLDPNLFSWSDLPCKTINKKVTQTQQKHLLTLVYRTTSTKVSIGFYSGNQGHQSEILRMGWKPTRIPLCFCDDFWYTG